MEQHHGLKSQHLENAEALFGGPQGLLRSAAAAVAHAGADHPSGHPADPTEQEIRALARFGHDTGLILDAQAARCLIENSEFVGKGMEHLVVAPEGMNCVLKDYDPRVFDAETCEVFYKPAELLFEYLTDHILANHFFGDDIRLRGFCLDQSHLHVLLTQPFIEGRHPAWQEMVDLLEAQGLSHERQGSNQSRFWVDGGSAGRILVTDVHEDNVIVTAVRSAHPIDVHFSFPSRSARFGVLRNLGLWEQLTSSAPSPPP
ncbi:MAG: hypothetical protein ACKVY0_04795 [Prosthecobacter sp.]|uniref:putative polyvalent protein kinase domain-containing protein n=1 Tax=Prosthecobacter sp. TaxID=1965333 RepID=UPI0038FDFDDD